MTWHPIATAPRDGTPILVHGSLGEPRYQVVFWYHRQDEFIDHHFNIRRPTHWQPLPPPPDQT